MSALAAWLEHRLPRLPQGIFAARLAALVLAAALPAFTGLPPVDRDEPSFAQSAKQMRASGNLVDIRFQDGTRYKKPVGIYWLQAATAAALGPKGDRVIWHYRLPSLLGILAAVLLGARIAAGFGGPAAGQAAGLMLAGSFLLLAEAHLATTDAVMLAAILAAQAVLARLYRAAHAAAFLRAALKPLPVGSLVLFWGALAATVLLKGPVGALVLGLTALALALIHRRAGWLMALRPGWGLLGLALAVLPWFVAITVVSGGAFWREALGHDLLGKVVAAQEDHGAPPGTYLALLWITFFPASIPLALTLPRIARLWRRPGVIFALAWVVPAWLVFELNPTKLMHYVMPLYPGLALAAALAWAEGALALRRWHWILAGLLTALPVAVLLAAAGFGARLGHLPWLPVGLGLLAIGLGAVFAARAQAEGRPLAALLGLWLAGAGFAGGLLGAAAAIPALWPARAIVALAQPSAACPARPIVTDGYDEPSLVFLAPATELATTPAGVAQAMAKDRCTLGIVSDPAQFLAAAAAGLAPQAVGQVKGLNLGTGRMVALTGYLLP